jgi:gliding motility-associated-like protein
MAPWCDMYQSPGGGITPGTIKYYTSGTAPCRTFVVSWCTPMFSCTTLRDTTQIVLHETTNVIEIFLKRHYGSCSWNSGRAVTGIENATGTIFYTAPGENGTAFNAINEGWKFQPSGTIIPWSYSWNGPSGLIATTPAITVCPTVNTTYTANATATTACGPVTITNTSVVNFISSPIVVTGPTDVCMGNSINLSSSYGSVWSSSNTSVAIVNSSGVVTGVGAGTAIITCSSGLCFGNLTINVNPTYNTSISAVICQGNNYLFAGNSYNTTGIYSHVFTTVKGCDSVVNLNLTVYPNPTGNFYAAPFNCINDSILVALNSISSDVISYNWNFTPANILYSAGLGGPYVVSYPSAGVYTINLILSNLYCTDTVKDTLQVMNFPDGRIAPIIYSNGNTDVCMGDELILQSIDKSEGLFYTWTPSQILDNPNVGCVRAIVEDTICIKLEVMNAFGCKSKDSVCINPKPCCMMDMPSAFTPNSDGENDKFRILNHSIKLHNFRIANRWGQIVFETSNLNEGWNGVFNGVPQDLGVYFYHILYECDGKQHEKKGDLTLIR